MRHALALATRALGTCAPNPAVGCVIVSGEGYIVGRGFTKPGGRPHAETVALAQAGVQSRGATAYVTLEPCAHTGETLPCADALIAAGVARVVAACVDPDPRVSGRGLVSIEAAGIAVTRDVCVAEATRLNEGFFKRIRCKRPFVALKIAESADGLVNAANARWITEEQARRHAHLLRARHDAILIGIETALVDDPELTCRLLGLEARSPLRIVLDTGLRLPLASKLVAGARTVALMVVAARQAADGEALRAAGAKIVRVRTAAEGRIDLAALLGVLAERGLTRLLVEGGPAVHTAFLAGGLADRLYIYRAPHVAGIGKHSALGIAANSRNAGEGFILENRRFLGPDILETYVAEG